MLVTLLPDLFCVLLLEMVVPEVDKNLLEELEAMGFSTARATRALHYSGGCHNMLKITIVYLLLL